MVKENLKVIYNKQIAALTYEMCLETTLMAQSAKPGMFINISLNDSSKLLKRPISICQIKDIASFKANPIRTICLYHYYRFLTEYCGYDKVWIMSNIATQDKELWQCTNILKDLPIIYGTSERYILNKHNIDDVFFHQSTPNFYGGTVFPHYPFNINPGVFKRKRLRNREKLLKINVLYLIFVS